MTPSATLSPRTCSINEVTGSDSNTRGYRLEAFGVHVPKGYIYGAMGFSVFVELINIRATRRASAVHLHQTPRVADIPT